MKYGKVSAFLFFPFLFFPITLMLITLMSFFWHGKLFLLPPNGLINASSLLYSHYQIAFLFFLLKSEIVALLVSKD